MSRWEIREAARMGNQAAIDSADDHALQARARELREENARRTSLAQHQIAYPADSDIDRRYQ